MLEGLRGDRLGDHRSRRALVVGHAWGVGRIRDDQTTGGPASSRPRPGPPGLGLGHLPKVVVRLAELLLETIPGELAEQAADHLAGKLALEIDPNLRAAIDRFDHRRPAGPAAAGRPGCLV